MKHRKIYRTRTSFHRKGANLFELSMYKILDDNQIRYFREYKIKTKQYDVFLPDYNCLIEFDGAYYHKSTFKECTNQMQKRNLRNDLYKGYLAKERGFVLYRCKSTNELKLLIDKIKE